MEGNQKTNTLLATLAIISTIATFLGSLTSIVSNLRSLFSYHILLVGIGISALLWMYLIVLKFQKKSHHVILHIGIYLIPALLVSSFFLFKPEEITCTNDKSISVGIANFDQSPSGADETSAKIVETFRNTYGCYTVFSLQTYIEPSNHPDSLKYELLELSEKVKKGLIVYGRKAGDGIMSCNISIIKPDSLLDLKARLDTMGIQIPKDKFEFVFIPKSDDRRICDFIVGTINYFQGDIKGAEPHFNDVLQQEQNAGFHLFTSESAPSASAAAPHDLESWSNFFLGNINVVNGAYDDAITHYTRSIANNAKNAHSQYNKAVIEALLGDTSSAISNFTTAHNIDSSFEIPSFALATENEADNLISVKPVKKPVSDISPNSAENKSVKPENNTATPVHEGPLSFLSTYERYEVVKGHDTYKVLKNGKWSIVSNTGEELTQQKYDNIGEFYGQYKRAAVCRDNKWGYIDLFGKEIIEAKYIRVEAFKKDGNAYYAKVYDEKWNTFQISEFGTARTGRYLENEN